MTTREVLSKFSFQVDHDKLDRMERQLDGIKTLLLSFGAVEITKGLYELAEHFSALGQRLTLMKESTGLSVEEVQQLTFAAQQFGVESGDMGRSLTILSQKLYEARMGSSEAQLAFSQVGISPDQVNGFRNSRDALFALSDSLRRIDDPIKRAALSKELLGRNSVRLAAFLGKGSQALRAEGEEARKLGLIISGPQVAALESLHHTFNKLHSFFEALGAMLASKVAPVIEYLVNDFLHFFAAHRELIGANFDNWWERFAYWLGFAYGLIKGVTIRVLDLAQAFHFEGKIFSLVTALGTLASAFFFLGPVGVLLGAVGVAVHDIWATLNGKPTWLDAFFQWLGIFQQVQAMEDYIADKLLAIGTSISDFVDKYGGIFSGVFSGHVIDPGAAGRVTSSAFSASGSVVVNAPMNFSVPAGTNPSEVGAVVGAAIGAHMDRLMRETQRSLVSTIAR